MLFFVTTISVTEPYDNRILHCVQRTEKLVFSHAHNSLIHISPLICHVVFCGLVVIAIAYEGRDTEFQSYLNCLLRDREILPMHSQNVTRKKKIMKKSPKTESKTILCSSNKEINPKYILSRVELFFHKYEPYDFRMLVRQNHYT